MLTTAPLRVAVLCSRRAPGLDGLFSGERARGRTYDLVAMVTSDPECVERGRFAAPLLVNDIRQFYSARATRLADLGPRADFDRATVQILEPFRPDLVVLCGYLHILTAPMLERFPERVINVHDSDLPRYPGLHATRDAILAGERETRSTVHLVREAVDCGPVIARSRAFPTHPLVEAARRAGRVDILKAYAYAQREWMMLSWGPLLARALDVVARDAVGVHTPSPAIA